MANGDGKKIVRARIRQVPELPDFGSEKGYIRLHLNECVGLVPPPLVSKILAPHTALLSTYPEYPVLEKAVARYAGVPQKSIALVNGSDDGILQVFSLLFEKGHTVLLPAPTFHTHVRGAALSGAQTMLVPYEVAEKTFAFPMNTVTALLKSAKQVHGLVLSSPANPTGDELTGHELETLAALTARKGIPLVVDEAYFEYGSGTTAASLLARFPNIVILRSFSKAFGLAGMRIGYVMAHPEVITEFKKLTLPWQVSHPSVRAGELVLKNLPLFKKGRRALLSRKHDLEAFFKARGYKTFSTHTNFILVSVPNPERATRLLRTRGILVRPLSGYAKLVPEFKTMLRISIPSASDTKAVRTACAAVFPSRTARDS